MCKQSSAWLLLLGKRSPGPWVRLKDLWVCTGTTLLLSKLNGGIGWWLQTYIQNKIFSCFFFFLLVSFSALVTSTKFLPCCTVFVRRKSIDCMLDLSKFNLAENGFPVRLLLHAKLTCRDLTYLPLTCHMNDKQGTLGLSPLMIYLYFYLFCVCT